MTLAAGQTLSHYEILGPLGAGGMGEVWRARDTRLDREVAIKVLPDAFAADEERLRRFEREAKSLASLNHPNVAGIHGVDQVGDTCFLALELVPGEDLAKRLARGALPVDEALEIGRQIAEGLEAAHEAGIVHRDLKPGNVRITPDGVVKLLDFGLAKPILPAFARGGTSTAQLDSVLATEDGLVLGTPTYMSPEQARGKPVDRRTDIWAFGCVMYECLTARRAFGGETATEILGAILHAEPDWSALPAATPPRLRELLRSCLVKSARARLRDIGDARLALERVQAGDDGSAGADGAAVTGANRRLQALALAGWLLALAAAAWAGRALLTRAGGSAADASPAVVRTSIPVPAEHQVHRVRISPDGRRIGYVSSYDESASGERAFDRIWVRELDAFDARPLAGSERADEWEFSPDGNRIAVVTLDGRETDRGQIRILSLVDGSVRELLPVSGWTSVAWETDESLLVLAAAGILSRVSAQGGAPESIADLAVSDAFVRIASVPRAGRTALLTRLDVATAASSIECVALETGERRPLLADHSGAAALADGYLVVSAKGSLKAVAFDPGSLQMRGVPVPVLEGPVWSWSISDTGTLVYMPRRDRGAAAHRTLVSVDRRGEARLLGSNPTDAEFEYVRCAPDGETISVVAGNRILLYGRDGGVPTRLVFPGIGAINDHCWHPDGERISFMGMREKSLLGSAIHLARTDGTGEPEMLFPSDEGLVGHWPYSWSPDGSALLVGRYTYAGEFDADILISRDGGELEPFVVTEDEEDLPAFSPDGRFVAYESAAGDRSNVLVCSWDPATGKPKRTWRASPRGGGQPRWAPDGSELYFVGGDEWLQAVSIHAPPGGGTLTIGAPQPLFDLHALRATECDQRYDVLPDGTFVILQDPEPDRDTDEIRVVQGWGREVEARVGG